MRVVQLVAENFKRLQAVEITPEGSIVTIGGKNGSGKSSVLDAIYVALKGRAANPPKPVRAGQEKATIRLDLGELIVTRTFTQKDGLDYTDTLKIERPNGDRVVTKPQQLLDGILGELGFDPFEFAEKEPKDQVAQLLEMVPLSVDLDDLAEADASDFANRRDVNRDGQAISSQLAAIPKEEVPENAPDRDALTARLASAADTNTAIERERNRREQMNRNAQAAGNDSAAAREDAARLRQQAEQLEERAAAEAEREKLLKEQIDNLPPLDEPVDAAAIQAELREAGAVLSRIERQKRRAELEQWIEGLRAKSAGFTEAMAERKRLRNEALAKAPMPVQGLGIEIDDKGAPYLTWEGLPFDKDQISTAIQLRVSTAIGMAANPTLRVLRIKDGSLLDEDSMAMLADMAKAEDFQLWVELVSSGGTGIIMENGAVRGSEPGSGPTDPDRESAPSGGDGGNPTKPKKTRAGTDKPEGSLL